MDFRLVYLPSSAETVCLYITHLTSRVCYVTIENYVCGIWALHDYMGYPHPDSKCFLIQSTLKGAKRLLGSESTPAEPLLAADLVAIYSVLDMSRRGDLVFWVSLCLSFRCLLRVGHVTYSPHSLRAGDVKFWEGGMDVTVRSSKTVQFQERVRVIPVVESKGSTLCPVAILKHYMLLSDFSPKSSLFPQTYNLYSSKLKDACQKVGLEGGYTSHSVRRGAAQFLAEFLPLHEVKNYGDWKSWSVLLYLADCYRTRRGKDVLVASHLASL